jgi:O-antigen/teichoic acid export membrane protein
MRCLIGSPAREHLDKAAGEIGAMLQTLLPSIAKYTKGFALVGAAQLASIIASFLVIKAIAGLTDTASAAEVILALSLAPFAVQMIFGPLAIAAAKYRRRATAKDQGADFTAAWKTLFIWCAVVFLLLCISGAAVGILIAPVSSAGVLLMALASAHALLFALQSTLLALDNAIENRRRVALFAVLTAVLRIAAVVAVVTLYDSGPAIVTALCLVYLITSLGQWMTRGACHDQTASSAVRSKSYLRAMLVFSLPILVWAVPAAAHLVADRWSLAILHGADAVASYGIIYGIAYAPAAMVGTVVTTAVWPVFLRKAADRSSESKPYVKKVAMVGACLLAALGVLMAAAVIPVQEQLVGFLASPAYKTASGLLPILILAGAINAALQLLSTVLLATNKSSSLLLPKVAIAVAGMLIVVLGAYLGGSMGAAIGLLVGNTVGWIALMLIVHQNVGIE